jgi:hypothetical protein
MSDTEKSDFPFEGPFPLRFGGFKLEKEDLKLISDLAKDQGLNSREYLESLIDWMLTRGYGPKN